MSRSSDEGGFTVVELMVTLAVMGLMASAALGVMFRVFSTTGVIENRRDLLDDGRIAMNQMTKQIRQATSVNDYVAPGDPTQIDINTFIGVTSVTSPTTRVVWRTVGSAPPYLLQVSTDGGTSYRTMVSSLASPNIFTYTEHDGVLDQVNVSLSLGLKTTVVNLGSEVELRNSDEGSG